jgi:hypothetical protein
MSYVLHDKNGYVCDLASATACLRFINWLKRNSSKTSRDFIRDGLSSHPRILANDIAHQLKNDPPAPHLKTLAEEYIKGLRRARGYAMLTQ